MLQVKEPLFVTIDDGRKMAYDEVSPPNPKGTILLLTGLGSKRLGWYKQLEALGQEYRTIAIDHRDTGDSDPVAEPYVTDDQAEDAASILKALGIEKAHVIGISMGGFIALHLILLHPELVDKLVLVATSAGGATHVPPSQEMMAMLGDRSGEIGEMAQRNYTKIMAPGYLESQPEVQERIAFNARYRPMSGPAYFRQLQAGLTHDVTARLNEIKVPTLVVHGDVDPLIPPANGRYLGEHIPGAKLSLYPNTGHILIIERAADFNREVLEFLDS